LLDRVGHVAQMEAPRIVARAFVALQEEARRDEARRGQLAIQPVPLPRPVRVRRRLASQPARA
jgi:hypothetical protein